MRIEVIKTNHLKKLKTIFHCLCDVYWWFGFCRKSCRWAPANIIFCLNIHNCFLLLASPSFFLYKDIFSVEKLITITADDGIFHYRFVLVFFFFCCCFILNMKLFGSIVSFNFILLSPPPPVLSLSLFVYIYTLK